MSQSLKLRAIIAVTDTENVSEDWNWFYTDIRQACEGTDIQMFHAQDPYLTIHTDHRDSLTIDLSHYSQGHRGYLFVETGREYVFQAYDQSNSVLAAASVYFGITLRR